MHGAAQSGGRCPKTLNGTTTGAGQITHGTDNAQNGSSSFSQGKGKKRELGVQGSDPVKRERIARAEDAEYDQLRPEQILKSEIAKITDRGGLVDFECVEKLVQLMQPDSVDKKLDLNCRIMLATVISVTDRFECLTRFVQLRGLPVLDDWLQEVHKGKLGDGSSPKGSDKSVDDFLLALLRALDKLPVNLHALQTCNIGKSVNTLRSHKNSDIQKKARSLVDTWKKRVEAEMNMIDAKSGSSRGSSWPNKSGISDVSNVGGRRTGGSSDPPSSQSCASKTPPPPAKPCHGEKFSLASPGFSKPSISGTATSGVGSTKDPNSVALAGSSDIPLITIKEEKSSSSSQSQNNSQSCSSDYGKAVAGREDARSSTAGSVNVNKIYSGVSRSRKSSNGIYGTAIFGVQKENNFGKFGSINRILSSEKVLPDLPLVDNGNTHRLIVRLPNTGRSPARSASGGSPEDVSATLCKGSPLVQPQKLENKDRKVKGKSEPLGNNDASNGNMGLSQEKDDLAGCDEGKVTSDVALVDERNRDGEGSDELAEASKATGGPLGIIANHRKSYVASFSSINALIDSCAKFSEANATASVATVVDDLGMNLLASVAAGEISGSDVSPFGSPHRKSPVPGDSCSGNDVQQRKIDDDRAQSEDLCYDESNGDAMTENSLCVKPGVHHNDIGGEEKIEECTAQLNSSIIDLPRNGSALSSDVKLPESMDEYSAAMLHVEVNKNAVGDEADEQLQVQGKSGKSGHTWARDENASNSKLVGSSVMLREGKTICGLNDKAMDNGVKISPESASTCAKVETKAIEESTSYSSLDRHEDKKSVNILSGNSNLKEQSPPHIATPCVSCTASGAEAKVEKDDEMKTACHTEPVGYQILDKQSSTFDHTSKISHGNLEKREVNGICSGGPVPMASPTPPLLEREVTMRSTRCKSDGPEASVLNNSSITAAGADTTVKLDFDLNEGFPADDGSSGELVKLPMTGNSSSVSLPFSVPISVSSVPGNGNSLVTVTAAAKGPFAPPENPLRIKGELGWKGSAATSAFRPAEPRKIVDISLGTTDTPLVDNSTSKSGRTFLDFDLNVPDQRALEDVASLNTVPVTHTESHIGERSRGELNLDLNRCDETPEIAQFSVNNSSRLEMAMLPGRSIPSGKFSNAESLSSRDFDLNNGPGLDDMGNDTAPHVKNGMPFLSSVPTVRMNNMELGNFSSWFPPGTSYSAITVPPILQGRGGEQSFSIFPAATSQRILGPPSANDTFTPEIFMGPVLSSSPAIGFPPNTPFQYPGFPFDTNFPLSTSSFSGVSTPFVDSSSGGPLCFPAVPSQLMGPNGVVSTQYSRPYVMSLPGGTSNIVPESRKWGGRGLDLNAGPGVAELDRRDERLPSTLRQLPISGSQALAGEQMKMYQMAGGVIKRKEPDGGWDSDRISYKNPSWQ